MNDQHSIVYVMRHIDVGNNIDIPYKKIGITGSGNATLKSRLQQISGTKSPIQAQYIIAWSHSDAKKVENAIHGILEDHGVVGEWFLDKNDNLVEKLRPIMALLGAEEIKISDDSDSYKENISSRESKNNTAFDQKLLDEIKRLLEKNLKTSIRKNKGPTVFGDKSELTFYINSRQSGKHKLHIGKCKTKFNKLKIFLDKKGFYCTQNLKSKEAELYDLSIERIAELINYAETEFMNSG